MSKRGFKKIVNNESGVILIAILVLSVVIMIFAFGLVSVHSSQAISAQHQIDRIKSEQLAKGAHWYNYMSLVTAGTPDTAPNETLDGKQFQVQVNPSGGAHPNGPPEYNIDIQYP